MKKYLILFLAMGLLTVESVIAQDLWDISDDTPPPTSNLRPLPRPQASIEPFRLLVFEQCEPNRHGRISYTGRLGITILSEYGAMGFIPHSTDSTLTLKLKSKNRGEKQNSFRIPRRSFTLSVILGEDTATFWVDNESDRLKVTYVETSELLLLESYRDLHGDIVPMQFMLGSTQKMVKQFVRDIQETFGTSIKIEQLQSGFYACLPLPFIRSVRIGRGKSAVRINKSDQGFLVCVQINDQNRFAEIAGWIYDRQKQELQRLRTERE